MNYKKALELSLNMIITIAIVLIILLISIYLISDGFKNFTKGTSCDNKENHKCIDGNKCNDEYPILTGWSCGEGKVCCLKKPNI